MNTSGCNYAFRNVQIWSLFEVMETWFVAKWQEIRNTQRIPVPKNNSCYTSDWKITKRGGGGGVKY
jgi:hypothetical protein